MKIEIKTKFDVGSIVYGFYNNRAWKFRVDGIKVNYETGSYMGTEIIYNCTAVPPKDKKWECTFNHTFEEHDLHTIDTLKELLNFIIEDNKKEGNT